MFDEVKNKLGQKKAWGTSLVAKETQAQMIAITHNLLVAYEQDLEERHDAGNTAEDQRRRERIESVRAAGAGTGLPIASLLLQMRRATQRSVKFIRWLRAHLFTQTSYSQSLASLQTLYATL